jgi:hypothetical protein
MLCILIYTVAGALANLLSIPKVLRFYGCWDDRARIFGDKHYYVINYFLADDEIEVLERYGKNEGRDPFPKLIKKSKVPKNYFGLQGIGVSNSDISGSYIHTHTYRSMT